MLRFSVLALSVISLLAACTIDPYEAGDGQYSYLKAEMADMHTAAKCKVDYAVTDTDEKLTFSSPFSCHWPTTPDSTYRAMLYYKKTPDKTEGNTCVKVWVLHPMKPSKNTPTDPVKLQSSWLSQNKKYINLRLGVMSGKPDDEKQKQKIGIVLNKQVTHANGKKAVDLQLLHNRNHVPSYYTKTLYISIPTASYKSGDSIRLKVNTYQGMMEKTFVL